MKIIKVLGVIFVLMSLFSASSTILVLDASGSMDDVVSGSALKKIDVAKEAGNTFLNNVKSGDEVALIVFYDCNDIKTEVPFTTDLAQIRTKMASVMPDSNTPIAGSIVYAANYATSSGRSGAGMIVLTDGEETCDYQSDAVAAAKNVTTSGPIKIINVVGFDISNSSSAQQDLQAIATAGGGKYYPAQDAGQLASSLTQAYQSASGGACCLPSLGLPALIGAALFYSRKK